MEGRVKNIALIGFMGSGKSAVGKRLARKLGYDFVDTDKEIERKNGRLIRQIWKEKGEEYFRQIESTVIKEVTMAKNKVIACGGGAVLDPVNIQFIKESCLVVYLKATSNQLYQRLKYATDRPLLNVPDAQKEIRRLLGAREKAYHEVSDLIVDTSGLTVDGVVDQIMSRIKQNGEFPEGR